MTTQIGLEQRWERESDRTVALLIEGPVDGGRDDDWAVVALATGVRLLKTSNAIRAGYPLVDARTERQLDGGDQR